MPTTSISTNLGALSFQSAQVRIGIFDSSCGPGWYPIGPFVVRSQPAVDGGRRHRHQIGRRVGVQSELCLRTPASLRSRAGTGPVAYRPARPTPPTVCATASAPHRPTPAAALSASGQRVSAPVPVAALCGRGRDASPSTPTTRSYSWICPFRTQAVSGSRWPSSRSCASSPSVPSVTTRTPALHATCDMQWAVPRAFLCEETTHPTRVFLIGQRAALQHKNLFL